MLSRHPRLDYVILGLVGLHIIIWFLPNPSQIHLGSDLDFPLNPIGNMQKFSPFSLWFDYSEGSPNAFSGPTRIFEFTFFYVFAKLGLPVSTIVELFLYVIQVVAGFSMYYMFSTLSADWSNRRIGALVASFSYMLSPIQLNAVDIVYLPFAFFPLYVAFYWRALTSPIRAKVLYASLTGVFFFGILGVFPNYRSLFHLVGVLLLIGLLLTVLKRTSLKSFLTTSMLFCIFTVALNLGVIVAIYNYLGNLPGGAEGLLSSKYSVVGGGGYATPLGIILLDGWNDGVYFSIPGIALVNLATVVLASSAVLLRPRQVPILVFSGVLVVAIALIEAVNSPGSFLGNAVISIYRSSPFLEPFASGDGYTNVILAMCYSFLLGAATIFLIHQLSETHRRIRIPRPILVGVVICLVLLNGWPLVNGTYFHDSLGNAYPSTGDGYVFPSSYYQADQWFVQANAENYRVLVLPAVLSAFRWPGLTGDGFGGCQCYSGGVESLIISVPTILYGSGFTYISSNLTSQIYSEIQKGNLDSGLQIAGQLNVKYVLFDGYALPYNSTLLTELKQSDALRPAAEFGNLTIFAIDDGLVQPRLYASGPDGLAQVRFQQLNPTLYRVTVNASKPFTLVLSEGYNQGWRLYSGSSSLFGIPIDDSFLGVARPGLNGYGNVWDVNIKGNGSYSFLVYYSPQTYFDLGLATSLLVLLAVLIYAGQNEFRELIARRFGLFQNGHVLRSGKEEI